MFPFPLHQYSGHYISGILLIFHQNCIPKIRTYLQGWGAGRGGGGCSLQWANQGGSTKKGAFFRSEYAKLLFLVNN